MSDARTSLDDYSTASEFTFTNSKGGSSHALVPGGSAWSKPLEPRYRVGDGAAKGLSEGSATSSMSAGTKKNETGGFFFPALIGGAAMLNVGPVGISQNDLEDMDTTY